MSTYAYVSDYTINPAYLDESVRPGDGIDMRDPLFPKVATLSPFGPASHTDDSPTPVRFGLETSNAATLDRFDFRTAASVHEEERIIAENFKGTYGLNSVSEAAKIASSERDEAHTTYALLVHEGETKSQPHADRRWPTEPLEGEPLPDADAVRERFFECYGTHYVSQVKYGLRIAVQAKMQKTTSTKSTELQVAFKAAFQGVGAEGGLNSQNTKALSDLHVDVLCEVSSGGLGGGGLLTLTNLDQIDAFFRSLSDGTRTLSVGPISVNLNHYPPTLNPGSRVYQAIKPAVTSLPQDQFGVPLGTVLAWYPPSSFVKGLVPAGGGDGDAIESRVLPPLGWAICDGTAGTPDLRDRFVLGTGGAGWKGPERSGPYTPVQITTDSCSGGHVIHSGGGNTHRPVFNDHTHTLTLPEPTLPPHVTLVYIMRVS